MKYLARYTGDALPQAGCCCGRMFKLVILLRAYLLEDILLVEEWGEMKTAK
jgi:hypothetical protein